MARDPNPNARWWEPLANEFYWLESTDRDDIGADLKAPHFDDAGADNWRYSLFKEARIGDVVFHYDKKSQVQALVGYSRISGGAVDAPIVWGARGTYAREKNALPRERAGYKIPLEGFQPLKNPVALADLRHLEVELSAIVSELRRLKLPLYFPFELSDKRPLRLLQGYAFKLPAAVVELITPLADGVLLQQRPSYSPGLRRNEPSSEDELYARVRTSLRLTSLERQRRLKASPKHAKRIEVQSSAFVRNPDVIAEVLERAGGVCEECRNPAPFVRKSDGTPYLEVHHVIQLAVGGEDTVENAIALCPNCHRKRHFG